MESMPPELVERLKKEHYYLVGRHSAVKLCRWLINSLIKGQTCYKQKFYGIRSHRCLQMTPAVHKCTHACVFCWRVQPADLGVYWDQLEFKEGEYDSPEFIVEHTIEAQRRLLAGYNPKAHPYTDPKKYEEALEPKHVAISLAGEPTIYPKIGKLIEEYHRRNMTTFLVTNGTLPEVLESITPPSQLYVTIPAPDKQTYIRAARPLIKDGWDRILRTISLIPDYKAYTVFRLTLVRNLNFHNPRGYAELINKGQPRYVELKSYMALGFSKDRLGIGNMLWHEEIYEFAKKIEMLTDYRIIDDSPPSRVVLLSREKESHKFTKGD